MTEFNLEEISLGNYKTGSWHSCHTQRKYLSSKKFWAKQNGNSQVKR